MAARKFNIFILLSIAGCTLSIIICGISLGTENWYHGVTKRKPNTPDLISEVDHGLFSGGIIRYSGQGSSRTAKQQDLYFCLGGECMYSCGTNSSNREQNMQDIINNKTGVGQAEVNLCPGQVDVDSNPPESVLEDASEKPERVFLSFALWLMTIIFIGGSIIFSVLSAGLGLYNTYSAPFQPILSVFGLYIWNGIAAGCTLLAMIIWGVAFTVNLNKCAAVRQTLTLEFTSTGQGSLGYSYWILLVALLLNLGNIALLRYRSWKILDTERNNLRVMDVKLTQGEILLF